MLIIDVIRSLLQRGTAGKLVLREISSPGQGEVYCDYSPMGSAAPSWDLCPAWPPDLFAVAASLIDKASCCMLAGPDSGELDTHRAYLTEVFDNASAWTAGLSAPRGVQARWDQLIAFGQLDLREVKFQPKVRDVLYRLLATADEASNGMGWAPPEPTSPEQDSPRTDNLLVQLVMTSLLDEDEVRKTGKPAYVLPFVPTSLCSLIMHDLAVVLPKSMISNVGCTIRSMSHHLALLPSSLQILPSWKLVDQYFGKYRDPYVDQRANSRRNASNDLKVRLLIVPFLFHIPETSFDLSVERQRLNRHASTGAFFQLHQHWLYQHTPRLSGERMVHELLHPLLAQARIECDSEEIHGIVMPECSLSHELANEVAECLRKEGIDFFITGALGSNSQGALPQNRASTYLFPKVDPDAPAQTGSMVMSSQSKHHRWSLDPMQVQRYALNFPERSKASVPLRADQWWEGIDISDRDLPFYAIRQGVSMAVLICEDLARTDPAMTAIRAVGPNLVVALLMDGPQLATRWPARYATVLADDPGSSVLTLTCAALVDRANWHESRPVRSIALWRDSGGNMKELNLPAGHHGMCLTLTANSITQHTIDSRSDRTSTRKLLLSSAVPLAIDHPPDWL